MQESANQRLAAAQAGRLQTQEAKGGSDIQLQKAKGQADVDRLIAEGEQRSQALELQKEGTLLDLEKREYDLARGVTADASSQNKVACLIYLVVLLIYLLVDYFRIDIEFKNKIRYGIQ